MLAVQGVWSEPVSGVEAANFLLNREKTGNFRELARESPIHMVKLLRAAKVTGGEVLLTGGPALDVGLFAAIEEAIAERKLEAAPRNHPDSIYAGAIGAAIWGGLRHDKLARLDRLAQAS